MAESDSVIRVNSRPAWSKVYPLRRSSSWLASPSLRALASPSGYDSVSTKPHMTKAHMTEPTSVQSRTSLRGGVFIFLTPYPQIAKAPSTITTRTPQKIIFTASAKFWVFPGPMNKRKAKLREMAVPRPQQYSNLSTVLRPILFFPC